MHKYSTSFSQDERTKQGVWAQREIIRLPDGSVVKNLPVNAGDTGFISGPGTSHMPRSN